MVKKPDLIYVCFRGSKEIPKTLKPGDKLHFTLSFDRGESSWDLYFDDLIPFIGVKHSIVEVFTK